MEMEFDPTKLSAGLSVQVVVVRGDGKVIKQIPWRSAVSQLIGTMLRLEKPRNWLLRVLGYENRQHEKIAAKIADAGEEHKKRLLSIGRQTWVWR